MERKTERIYTTIYTAIPERDRREGLMGKQSRMKKAVFTDLDSSTIYIINPKLQTYHHTFMAAIILRTLKCM
jgi:hypothetical protein